MTEGVHPALVLAHARAWIGTPFVVRAARRGAGADCTGLVRGLMRELSARDVAPPPWRQDWAAAPGEPILDALRRLAVPVPLVRARPGHVVTYRIGGKRAAHLGVLSASGVIHAWEVGGVRESAPLGRRITTAWALPLAPGCAPGPATFTAADCRPVIRRDAAGFSAVVMHRPSGTALARTVPCARLCALMTLLPPPFARTGSEE